MNEKVALASCNGMSPNGLVSRVAVGDAKKEDENIISICMGSTSADIKGENNAMLKKYPIISINGCNGECINKILENKSIKVKKSINVGRVLENFEVWANDNYEEFESLKDGAKIAMLLPNTDNLIILEKRSEISVKIDDRYSFEFPFAEIGFKFNEDAVDKVLNDKTLKTFQRLTSNDEIEIMSFVKEEKLVEYEYTMFLRKFVFEIKCNCSCGCC